MKVITSTNSTSINTGTLCIIKGIFALLLIYTLVLPGSGLASISRNLALTDNFQGDLTNNAANLDREIHTNRQVFTNKKYAQNKQLGNLFYSKIPFVDIDSRLPSRDQPEYLRERASGKNKSPGSQELIDPYAPLPWQQPPPVLPYDQGVDLPEVVDANNQPTSEQNFSLFDLSISNAQRNQANPNQSGNTNLSPMPQMPQVSPRANQQYSQQSMNQIPLPPLSDEDQTAHPEPIPNNNYQVRKTQSTNHATNFSNVYTLPRADFQGDLSVDFHELPTDEENPQFVNQEELVVAEQIIDPEQTVATIKEIIIGKYSIHIASYYNIADADRGWKILTKATRNTLVGLKKSIVKVQIRGKTYYRLLAGSFDNMVNAEQICRSFKNVDLYCVVMSVRAN